MSDEFDRLLKMGVKLNMHALRLLALHLLDKKLNGVYGKGLVDSKKGKIQESMIKTLWTQSYPEFSRTLPNCQPLTIMKIEIEY